MNNLIKILRFKKLLIPDFLLLVASVYLLLPETIFSHVHIGLDASWMIAINMAVKQGLIFGKEFIFTYGPLGFLSTGLPLYIPDFIIVLFQVFILVCIIFIIHYYLKQLKSTLSKVGCFVFLLLTFINLHHEKKNLLLIFFLSFIFYSLSEYRTENPWKEWSASLEIIETGISKIRCVVRKTRTPIHILPPGGLHLVRA